MTAATLNDDGFPVLEGKPSTKHCSNCSSKLMMYVLPGHYNSKVEIDVCMDCNAIWFDQFESVQLSPDGTVQLFQLIHERGGAAASGYGKFGEGLRCITCGDGMKLTHDKIRNSRFSYQACRKGHGRFTTFHNFLMEKQFVRELSINERNKLAATVKQIRCSGCGAAVNIGKVDACEYCRAPVSVFDRDAAKKAIEHYLQERRKHQPSAHAPTDRREGTRSQNDQWSSYDRADLGSDILYALSRAAMRMGSGAGRTVPAAAAGGIAVDSGAFADAKSGGLPDATSALFGGDMGAGVSGIANAASSASSGIGSVLGSGVGEAASASAAGLGKAMEMDTLPSATDALFGSVSSSAGDAAASVTGGLGSEIASVFSEAASSGIGESVASAAADLSGDAIESVGGSLLETVADSGAEMAGDIVSSAGGGIVDLVTDGIGSLLGAIFD